MMGINNFKNLEKEEFNTFDPSINRIRNNVIGSLGLFKLIADSIELFLPNVVDTFLNMSKGPKTGKNT